MSEKERTTILAWLEKAQVKLEKDKGLRTVMKRAAGKNMAAAGGAAIAGFYKLQPLPYREEVYFDVICLMCLWDVSEWKKGRSLPAAAKKCLPVERRDAFGKKLETLLDLSIDEDGYFQAKLCRLVKYIQNNGAVIDAAQLLHDLMYWESDMRFVQKRWVKEFYQDGKEDEGEGEIENVD